MLLFWKVITFDDIAFYQQDPTASHNMTSSCNSTSSNLCRITQTDRIINYVIGSLFILPFLTSTLLNPLVFCYFNKTKKISDKLFKSLAVSDFMTTIVTPVTYTVLMFDSQLHATSSIILRQARPFCCIFGCISQVQFTSTYDLKVCRT